MFFLCFNGNKCLRKNISVHQRLVFQVIRVMDSKILGITITLNPILAYTEINLKHFQQKKMSFLAQNQYISYIRECDATEILFFDYSFCKFQKSRMSFILHNFYGWYRNLMDNKSGKWSKYSVKITSLSYFMALSIILKKNIADTFSRSYLAHEVSFFSCARSLVHILRS